MAQKVSPEVALQVFHKWRDSLFSRHRWGAKGPERFFEHVLGVEPHDWQREFLRAYGRGDRKITVVACHGPGKTFTVAGLVWYQLLEWMPQKVVITAPSRGQLEGALWGEVMKFSRNVPDEIRQFYNIKKGRIELFARPEDSWVEARTARAENPEALQGIHCEGGRVLLIADEASGVSDKIFESAQGSMSGQECTTILIGNGTRASGYFFESHKGEAAKSWTKFSVGYKDSPLVTDDFEEEVALQYGRDSNQYRIRVLGKFPTSGSSVIIPRGWVDDAVTRHVDPGAEPIPSVWGLDVAGGGVHAEGSNALVKRTELGVDPHIMYWPGDDPMQVVARVQREFMRTPSNERPKCIMVDMIGIGGGVYSRLRELGLPVRGVNVSETRGIDSSRYQNLKIELWWRAREWLGRRSATMPECDGSCAEQKRDRCVHMQLRSELSAVQYEVSPTGRMKCEEKKKVIERTGLKLDLADAMVLTFAEDIGIMHGTGPGTGWPKDRATINMGSV
ncbi:hypothetical protein [Candidatus Poriferisocius sp.]|uniref:hypothetical protein n=1 Tax=Candidatus Poriferisocius sp. TaxID=3101276 RepID=UPI003B52A9EB